MDAETDINSLVICTPTHLPELTTLEIRRIRIALKYNPGIPHVFVLPENISSSFYRNYFPSSLIVNFPEQNFADFHAYNQFMLKKTIYEYFRTFRYMLIMQSDAFLTRNIKPLLNLNYSYIGAPWIPGYKIQTVGKRLFFNKSIPFVKIIEIEIGNGGLSLRKISDMLMIVDWWQGNVNKINLYRGGRLVMNEDLAISYAANKLSLPIPSLEDSKNFFLEKFPSTESSLDVFGFHGLNKYNPELELELIKQHER